LPAPIKSAASSAVDGAIEDVPSANKIVELKKRESIKNVTSNYCFMFKNYE